MVISTETICAPEQGYMVFSYLKFTVTFVQILISEGREKAESPIKVA